MNGFERRTELKKKNILDTAFELFSRQGIQKVSIQEIAKKAEVSQVTIYNYFGSKDQLLVESVKSFAFSRIEEVKDLLHDPSLAFDEKIRQLITLKMDNIFQFDLEFMQALMSDRPELKEFIDEFSQSYTIPLFMDLLEEGKEAGFIHHSISLQMMMFYVDMYYQAMRNHKEFFQSEESLIQFTEQILHMFFYGITGKTE
ncbi:TetR family transcriptional regulator [Pontibacillus yanchengensis]|uniref:TetR family transcriptional regulator n=2 Tax=Pontibacillus yanchengensis TaxID=462910 RepID=A0ACC7VFU0_9BACI|nr:TetR/AcrR family transcriptional regulator [Pontibacillus yanchengensis]MYL32493.1 TetR family transcriptional regulator [Pontibacillus yanchengensis]MYL53074.1 TetR family transcriptional regulator [Pontibacillus yanchengensis]